MKKHLITLLMLAVLLPGLGLANTGIIEHAIQSEPLKSERRLDVRLPASYAGGKQQRYPVLYVLDGESNLEFSTTVVNFLADNGVMPEMIVVGIRSGTTRSQDFLPGDNSLPVPLRGNAQDYMTFLAEELVPLVDSTYRTAGYRILSGHSYGGILATLLLAERTELFEAILVQSPYLDAQIGPTVIDRVQNAVSDSTVQEVSYFGYSGQEPNLDPQLQTLQALLRSDSAADIDWQFTRDPAQDHMTTRMLGLYNGLVFLFDGHWELPAARLTEQGAEAVDAHLQQLSQKYQHPVRWSESLFQQTIQLAMGQQDLKSAVRIAKLYTDQHSASPLAYLLQASVFARSGKRGQALKAVENGLVAYQAAPNPALEPVHQNLRTLKQQLVGAR